jgi:hypothetical protein
MTKFIESEMVSLQYKDPITGKCIKPIQSNLSKPNSFGTEVFVQFRQVFGLYRFKLHRHLVDGAVKSV